MNHNNWLFLMFSVYIIAIFVFGILYYELYRRNRSYYSFTVDILNSRKLEFNLHSNSELKILEFQDSIFQELLERLDNKETIFSQTKSGVEAILHSGVRVELSRELDRHKRPYTLLTMYTHGGKELLCWKTTLSTEPHVNTDKLMVICSNEIESIRNRMNHIKFKLETFETITPDVWNFVDFLYFSTITQTTVGYSDILPNSSTVRICVVIQILTGYLILAILLNIAFG